MMYTIRKHPKLESLEITFDGKPSETVRTALKGLRFRWAPSKGVWYGYATEEAVRAAIDEAQRTESEEAGE